MCGEVGGCISSEVRVSVNLVLEVSCMGRYIYVVYRKIFVAKSLFGN